MLGYYDFVTVIQATDNETVTHLSVDLGSCVTVKIVTLPAISIAQRTKGAGEIRRRAESLANKFSPAK